MHSSKSPRSTMGTLGLVGFRLRLVHLLVHLHQIVLRAGDGFGGGVASVAVVVQDRLFVEDGTVVEVIGRGRLDVAQYSVVDGLVLREVAPFGAEQARQRVG